MPCGASHASLAEVGLVALRLSTLHIVVCHLDLLEAGRTILDFGLLVFPVISFQIVTIMARRIEVKSSLPSELLATGDC